NTSSRSSLPCPCNPSSSDWQSSCTVPRSSSTASRCSSSPHSTHSSSTPLVHSPPSPLGSSVPPVDSCSTLHCRSSSEYSGQLCLLPSPRAIPRKPQHRRQLSGYPPSNLLRTLHLWSYQ